MGVIAKSFEELAGLAFDDVPYSKLEVLKATYYCGVLTAMRIAVHLSNGEHTGEDARRAVRSIIDECEAYLFLYIHGGRE